MKHAFQVEGMTCEHCEKAVVRAIKLLDRAAVVTADRVAKKVEVDSALAPESLNQAIVEEGYRVMD